MKEDELWFWLCNIEGIYQPKIKRLLAVYKSPENIFGAKIERLEQSGILNSCQLGALAASRKSLKAMRKYDRLREENIRFIYPNSEDYPECFEGISDMPYSLYVKGRLPEPEALSVAMVGARRCSEYGKKEAEKYAAALSRLNIQIISGMARGIDSVCQRTVLLNGGSTFAVLGSGIDVIYPWENNDLYCELCEKGGVISEYPPGTAPVGWQFPHRNRLISALSRVVLIFEARKKSGTLSTAEWAASQGKDVFALPGRAGDPLSEGCNRLIADGAGVLLSPAYLAEALYAAQGSEPKKAGNRNINSGGVKKTGTVRACQSSEKQNPVNAVNVKNVKKASEPSETETDLQDKSCREVFALLGKEAMPADDIIEKSGLGPAAAQTALSRLELLGLIEEVGHDYYRRSR